MKPAELFMLLSKAQYPHYAPEIRSEPYPAVAWWYDAIENTCAVVWIDDLTQDENAVEWADKEYEGACIWIIHHDGSTRLRELGLADATAAIGAGEHGAERGCV